VVADAGAFNGGGGVIRVNPLTGARTTVSENSNPPGGPSFFDPIQLALAPNGDLLVTDSGAFGGGGGVIRVNPLTGVRTTMSENASPPGGPSFSDPIGIALAANGHILVSGFTALNPGGGVTRVNPSTGVRTTVSENSSPPGGPSFAFPSGIVVEPDTVAPQTVITEGPSGETREHAPSFSFASSEPGSRFRCSVDGLPPRPCSSPFTVTRLGPGSHRFAVAATDPAGNTDPSPARRDFRVLASLQDLPPPLLARSANVEPVSGSVLVALPRGSSTSSRVRTAQKGLTFVPLTEARQIPIGSFLNTRRGRVRLQTAARARGRPKTGVFFGGLFQVLQSRKRSAKGLTELRLKGSSFRGCAPRQRGSRALSSRRRLSRRTKRRLRGDAKGRFRTRGRYSAATVRGTDWTVADRCDGTFTTVKRGTVVVRDFRRRRNVAVRRGKRYLARAPG
jgi:hypothetical protein